MAADFADDFSAASFVKSTPGAYDVDDPAGPTEATSATYTCRALALAYGESFVEGDLVKQAAYSVVILRGTIRNASLALTPSAIPNPGDTISVPPPNETVAKAGAIIGVSAVTQATVTVQVRGELL